MKLWILPSCPLPLLPLLGSPLPLSSSGSQTSLEQVALKSGVPWEQGGSPCSSQNSPLLPGWCVKIPRMLGFGLFGFFF